MGMPPKSVRNRSPTFTPGHRCEQTGKCIINGIKPGAPFRSVNTCYMSLHSTVVIVLIYVTHNRPISLSHRRGGGISRRSSPASCSQRKPSTGLRQLHGVWPTFQEVGWAHRHRNARLSHQPSKGSRGGLRMTHGCSHPTPSSRAAPASSRPPAPGETPAQSLLQERKSSRPE